MKIDFEKYSEEELEYIYVNLFIMSTQVAHIPLNTKVKVNPIISVWAILLQYVRSGLLQNGFSETELQTLEQHIKALLKQLSNTPEEFEGLINAAAKTHVKKLGNDKPDLVN